MYQMKGIFPPGLDTTQGVPAPPMPFGLAPYFRLMSTRCPYELGHTALYHELTFASAGIRSRYLSHLPDGGSEVLSCLVANGYRRNGNHLYTMRCPRCAACVPIRIDPLAFQPNRDQKRVWKKNQDVLVRPRPDRLAKPGSPIVLAPVTMTDRKVSLLEKFLRTRFGNTKNEARLYYGNYFAGSICETYEMRYWAGSELIGVGIVDIGADWLNAVYFYFDPDQQKRSPGTFNILTLIDFCREYKISKLYLGYWIQGLSAMDYKKAFKPHELLYNSVWYPVY